jgi:hypothetical protein
MSIAVTRASSNPAPIILLYGNEGRGNAGFRVI